MGCGVAERISFRVLSENAQWRRTIFVPGMTASPGVHATQRKVDARILQCDKGTACGADILCHLY